MLHLFLTACGLVGNLCFGLGCVPTAYRTLVAGKSVGTPVSLAWLLTSACATFYTYLLGTYGWNWLTGPLGVVETAAWAIVLILHYFPSPRPPTQI